MEILNQLQDARNNSDIRKQKRYIVFKSSFDAFHCYTQRMILQKINYIHANPCSKKWLLASNAVEYPHSSALYYHSGIQGCYPITNWMELESSNWWD